MEYQVIEPVDSCYEAREDDDIEVSPYEALVINDASKIGATESTFDLKPQQDVITPDPTPHHTLAQRVIRYLWVPVGRLTR